MPARSSTAINKNSAIDIQRSKKFKIVYFEKHPIKEGIQNKIYDLTTIHVMKRSINL